MKTLFVLSALAAIAVAAPSFMAKDQTTYPEYWPEYTRRDKKSPQGYFYAESSPLNIDVPAVHTEAELDHSSPSARTFGLKKHHNPTIIKNPSGYHLYRDSSEERAQADPSENCTKHVKVKLCDGEKKERSMNEEHNEDAVESSIKMAKEAIEHLQRDLKIIEHSPKSASWNERDVSMHEDIEVARKALDHIHRNFGNLESMSLHSTLVDDNQSHKINEGETHEEKATQWKDHTKTFKSNVEGARNMEDLMKSPEHHESSSNIENIDTTKLMKNSKKTEEHLLNEAPLKEMKESHERHANTDIKTMSDMNTSPTEVKESKMEHNHQLISEKSATDAVNLSSFKGKASDLLAGEKSLLTQEIEHHESNIDGMLAATENHHQIELPRNTLEEKNVNQDSFKGKASDLLASEKSVVNKESDHHESQIDGKLRAAENHHQIELNKPAVIAPATSHGLDKTETEHFRKTSEQEWNQHIEKHLKQPKSSLLDTESTRHSEDMMKKDFEKSHLHEEKKMGHFETSMKSAEANNMLKTTNEHHEIMNKEKLMTPTRFSSEKSADSMPPARDFIDSHMRWAPERNGHLETTHMKAATEFYNQHPQPGSHMFMQHHTDPAVESSNHVNTMGHLLHGHSTKIHEHEHAMNHAKAAFDGFKPDLKTSMIMDHAKAADFNGFVPQALPRNLIDFTGKSAMDLMQWTHKTDGGRSAYGAYGGSGINIGGGAVGGASGGGGAVGVFPNAHVGNCAVPLLLSCSPSVVSGSLAKSGYGSSYGSAPAYRATEDVNFINKRDAKKTKDATSKKIIKQRTITADKKQ